VQLHAPAPQEQGTEGLKRILFFSLHGLFHLIFRILMGYLDAPGRGRFLAKPAAAAQPTAVAADEKTIRFSKPPSPESTPVRRMIKQISYFDSDVVRHLMINSILSVHAL
jgi:hypothetical protein